MGTDGIDWVFDASREGTFPEDGGSWWRLALKYGVLEAVLTCLATLAVVVTFAIHPQNVSAEFAFAVVMGVMILLFCIFLVWMTYRRAARRRRARDAEDMALNREIAKYYREKRQGMGCVTISEDERRNRPEGPILRQTERGPCECER